VRIKYEIGALTGWPSGSGGSDNYWYEVTVYKNKSMEDPEVLYIQRSRAVGGRPLTEGSDILQLQKGDEIVVKLEMIVNVPPENVNAVAVCMNSAWLEANIETPYKYIWLFNK